MDEKKLGQEPAFPSTEYKYTGDGCHNYVTEQGMSKRFYAACAAMQGMLSNTEIIKGGKDPESIVKVAYKLADELLRQENL